MNARRAATPRPPLTGPRNQLRRFRGPARPASRGRSGPAPSAARASGGGSDPGTVRVRGVPGVRPGQHRPQRGRLPRCPGPTPPAGPGSPWPVRPSTVHSSGAREWFRPTPCTGGRESIRSDVARSKAIWRIERSVADPVGRRPPRRRSAVSPGPAPPAGPSGPWSGRFGAVCRASPRRSRRPAAPGAREPPPGRYASVASSGSWSTGASSVFRAAASIAASDLRTWLRSVVYQKSGSEALR